MKQKFSRIILCISICVIFIFTNSCTGIKKKQESYNNDSSSQIKLTGVLEKVKEFPGTLSEFSSFILVNDKGKRVILFNEKKRSMGFDDYVQKRVIVIGEYITGYIGWRKTPTDGFMVKDISINSDSPATP